MKEKHCVFAPVYILYECDVDRGSEHKHKAALRIEAFRSWVTALEEQEQRHDGDWYKPMEK